MKADAKFSTRFLAYWESRILKETVSEAKLESFLRFFNVIPHLRITDDMEDTSGKNVAASKISSEMFHPITNVFIRERAFVYGPISAASRGACPRISSAIIHSRITDDAGETHDRARHGVQNAGKDDSGSLESDDEKQAERPRRRPHSAWNSRSTNK